MASSWSALWIHKRRLFITKNMNPIASYIFMSSPSIIYYKGDVERRKTHQLPRPSYDTKTEKNSLELCVPIPYSLRA